jgi:hypothetical protein
MRGMRFLYSAQRLMSGHSTAGRASMVASTTAVGVSEPATGSVQTLIPSSLARAGAASAQHSVQTTVQIVLQTIPQNSTKSTSLSPTVNGGPTDGHDVADWLAGKDG